MAGTQGDHKSPLMAEEHEEKENEERWLLTYADMITLLVAFFIMMYSLSVLNLEKFKQFAFAIRSGFTGEMDGKKGENIINQSNNISVDPFVISTGGEGKNAMERKSNLGNKSNVNDSIFASIKKEIENLKINKKLLGVINLEEREGNLYIVILTDRIFFKTGEAELTEEAKEILKEIGKILKPLSNEISIEGYTSDSEIINPKYRNNWELSAARAISVIEFFESKMQINPQRMSLTGYGQWRKFSKSENEKIEDRVVIAVMKKTFKKGGK